MQIRQYLIRRLLILPLLVVGVSIVVFSLTRIGGSPVAIYLSHEMTPDEVEMRRNYYSYEALMATVARKFQKRFPYRQAE